MTSPFDIFQAETNGCVLWLESATTIEQAKARVQELAVHAPGEYLLFNQRTGDKLVVKTDNINHSKLFE